MKTIEDILREENTILKEAFYRICNYNLSKKDMYKLLEETFYKIRPLEKKSKLRIIK